jgi:hypothetical protein
VFLDLSGIGLRGAKGDVIYRRAQEENWIIITGGLGFANSLRYPFRKSSRYSDSKISEAFGPYYFYGIATPYYRIAPRLEQIMSFKGIDSPG